MPEPAFSAEDRVNPQVNLPKELVEKLNGKSAQEQTSIIVDYFSKREKGIIDTAREAIRTQDPTKLGDKTNTSVRMERQTENTNPPQAVVDGATATMIAAAETQAKIGKKYWSKFESEIKSVMSKMAPENRVDFNYWEAVYFNLVGSHKDEIEAEERTAAETATRLAAERASASPDAGAPPPAALPAKVTEKVLPGLGISEERYRKGQEQINKGEWPLTGVSK